MPKTKESEHRNYVFTLPNMSEDELRAFMKEFNTSFWEAGDEVCPSTGTQHWQGWLRLKRARTFTLMKRDFCKHGHVEIMNGKPEHNEKYCNKDGKGIREGVRPNQGRRTDIEEALECESVRELFDRQTPNFQSLRVLEKHLEYCEQPSVREVQVHRIGMEDFREYAHVYLEDAYVFAGIWHGYDGQSKLIQFMGGQLNPIPTEVYEGLPYRVQAGGTSRQVRVTDIILVK